MYASIENSREDLAYICERRNVLRLELFGSVVHDDFGSTSDFDCLVEFKDVPSLEEYFGLKSDLEALFGRSMDLIMPRAVVNPYIRAEIDRDRKLLYAA